MHCHPGLWSVSETSKTEGNVRSTNVPEADKHPTSSWAHSASSTGSSTTGSVSLACRCRTAIAKVWYSHTLRSTIQWSHHIWAMTGLYPLELGSITCSQFTNITCISKERTQRHQVHEWTAVNFTGILYDLRTAVHASDSGTDYKHHLHRAERAVFVPYLKKLNAENQGMEIIVYKMDEFLSSKRYIILGFEQKQWWDKARGKKNITWVSPN